MDAPPPEDMSQTDNLHRDPYISSDDSLSMENGALYNAHLSKKAALILLSVYEGNRFIGDHIGYITLFLNLLPVTEHWCVVVGAASLLVSIPEGEALCG